MAPYDIVSVWRGERKKSLFANICGLDRRMIAQNSAEMFLFKVLKMFNPSSWAISNDNHFDWHIKKNFGQDKTQILLTKSSRSSNNVINLLFMLFNLKCSRVNFCYLFHRWLAFMNVKSVDCLLGLQFSFSALRYQGWQEAQLLKLFADGMQLDFWSLQQQQNVCDNSDEVEAPLVFLKSLCESITSCWTQFCI